MKPSNASPTAGAEAVVQRGIEMSPIRRGALRVEPVEFRTGIAN
jgi:hypothetical protein